MPRKSNTSASQAAQGLAKIALAIKHQSWHDGPRRLHPAQAQILSLLLQHEADPSPRGIAWIADQLAVTPATVSDSVRVLAERKLVAKRTTPGDRRALAITLTAAGRRAAQQAAEWPDPLAAAVDQLTPAEHAVFLIALTKMVRHLQTAGKIPVARMCASCTFFKPHAYENPSAPHHCDFVNAPFGDGALRLDCPDHSAAEPGRQEQLWQLFVNGKPAPELAGTNSLSKGDHP